MRRALRLAAGALLLLATFAGCAGRGSGRALGAVSAEPATASFVWQLPAGFPEPRVPDSNPMSRVKVELGRRLFYDNRLSGNGTMACAACHRQELAFTDGHAQARGSTGETHRRGAMSLANVAYNASYAWASRRQVSLELQMLRPMLGTDPIELGLSGRLDEVLARFQFDVLYPELFVAAFPDDPAPVSFRNIVRAIAAFERTLISGDSPYDRFVYWGDSGALSEAAKRGRSLFFSAELGCSLCHAGFNFSGPVDYERAPRQAEPTFHNNGLYDLDGRGTYPASDRGLVDETGRRRDMGAFRAPTLRNIEVTAPYMHDGSLPTLEAVVDHYASGGRGGARSRYRSRLVAGFDLNPAERRDLVAFLRSLTDTKFLDSPAFGDPTRAGPPVESEGPAEAARDLLPR